MKKLRGFLPDKLHFVVADRRFRGEQLSKWCKESKIDVTIYILAKIEETINMELPKDIEGL
jgi:hypothetical protein